jgi:hypothetical protein
VLSDEEKKSFDKTWNEILNGKTHKHKTKINLLGKEYTLLESYTPTFDQNGQLVKILKIAMDISNI